MPSYLHNRIGGGGEGPTRPHHHSQYHSSGATTTHNSFGTSAQQSMGQQQPTTTFAQGSSNNGPFIPPPPGSTYQTTTFQCDRCKHHFDTRAELDRHSFSCGAAALFTGYFTPYPVEQKDYYHSTTQQQGPSSHGAGGFQNQGKRRGA